MTESQFNQLAAEGYNRIPLVLETFADLDTPLSVYLKLANRPGTYLLESVVGGERFGRYSFIGLPARTRIVVRGDGFMRFAYSATITIHFNADGGSQANEGKTAEALARYDRFE